MGKRFAIVIGVATGVMALGAQTATAAPEVVKYDTRLTITLERMGFQLPRPRHVRGGKCERDSESAEQARRSASGAVPLLLPLLRRNGADQVDHVLP